VCDNVSGGLSEYRGREITRLEAVIGRLDEDVAAWISRAVDAEATVERVKALHVIDRDEIWCDHDGFSWPCPTLRALGHPCD
jgi:hypothetical protein